MKFQNCILINFVTGAQMDAGTCEPKAICPFNFSKVGGITKILMTNGSLMKVESIAEFSSWSILQYF